MKKLFILFMIFLPATACASNLGTTTSLASKAVMISEPVNGASVSSPVKVCMETIGLEVQPAKMGVNKGKGHHHIIVDEDLPTNFGNGIAKDANHIHMGDGSKCKSINLSSGKHVIRTLFAQGNHVPFSPALTATVIITVK